MSTPSRRRRWRVLPWPGCTRAGLARWLRTFRGAGWSVSGWRRAASSCRSCSPPAPPCGRWGHRYAARWRRTSRVAGSTCTWPTYRPRWTCREERDADGRTERDGRGTSPSATGTDPCPPPRQGWGRYRVHPTPPTPRSRATLERELSGDEVRSPAPLVAGRGVVDPPVATYLTATETRRLTRRV